MILERFFAERTPDEQRARNHAAAMIHKIRRQRDEYNKNIIDKYTKIKEGKDPWWSQNSARGFDYIADTQIADNNAFCDKWSKKYLNRGKEGRMGYSSGVLSKLGDYISSKEHGKRYILNNPDYGMLGSGEHTTVPFHKALDTRYDYDDYFGSSKDAYHGIVPKVVRKRN